MTDAVSLPAEPARTTPSNRIPPRPMIEHHHRDIHGGAARAAVFGVSDGLVSNVSLILGVAGADAAPGIVRLAGLSGLIAGAVSMAAGEYVSMKAQAELLGYELEVERREHRRNPTAELHELAQIYASQGVEPERARQVAEDVMADPETALHAHAREELGIDPHSLGSPVRSAASSFAAFTLGAVVPLLPWFFSRGDGAVAASVVLSVLAALAIGVALARFTRRSMLRSALRQVAIAAFAAGVTFAVGSLVGVGVS